MTATLTFSAALAIASALGVALLGATAIIGGRSRARGAFAFGLFGLAWGFQILFANLATVSDDAFLANVFYLLDLVVSIPLPFFLVEFAAAQAPSGGSRWRIARVATATIAMVAVLLLFGSSHALYTGVRADGGAFLPVWGAGYAPLVVLPFYVAFGAAAAALMGAMWRAPTPRTMRAARFLVTGVALFLASISTKELVIHVVLLGQIGSVTEAIQVATFGALAGLLLVAATRAGRRARDAPGASDRREFRVLQQVIAIPLALGGLEGLLNVTLFPTVYTVGLWRLAGVAVIAYGLARWRFYDLPQRTTRAAATASGTTVATAGAAAAYGATTLATGETALPLVAALLVLGAAIIPSVRFARRLFGVSEVRTQKADDQLYGQRIDAYRAALEASLARDSLAEDREFLAALRERFGITAAEERVLLHYARSSVIVARPDKAFEAFERLRLLGEGGGGRTWLARDRARDRLVVLKEPLDKHHADPEMRENVLREARLAARVRHPNVVNVEQVVEAKGAPVIVMEYLEGGSLADVLRARGTLPWREAVEMAMGVLRGVEAVHAAGIVHRDVKPSNVLIGAEGMPKVADFGVAIPANGGGTIVEGNSTFAGTLSYIAPEVRVGGKPADRRSDVYACAALLHECLHGAPPGRTAVIVQNDVPAALSVTLARGLADDPDARYPTARAFAEDLARALR